MEQRETAGLTIRLIVEQVRRDLGEEGVHRLLELAGETRPLEVLESARTWHSFDTRQRMFSAGAELTDDPDFAMRVGASVLSSKASVLLRALMGPFGSPSALLRALPVVASKFDTACESRLRRLDPGHAIVELETKKGYTPSPHDCRYTMGLLTQVSALFGLPPATVAQLACQVTGAPCCTFDVRWEPRRTWLLAGRTQLRRTNQDAELVQLQLEHLQSTVAELMVIRDAREVLAKVVELAGTAVAAQQLLLAVRLREGGPLEVRAEGLEPPLARRLGLELSEGTASGVLHDGVAPKALVAQVRSGLRDYGKLVAFSSAPFLQGEQALLDAYARIAATTLDASLAIAAAADRRREADALRSFAARLIRVQDTEAIASATVDATLDIVETDRSIVFRYEEGTASLVTAAQRGYDGAIGGMVVTARDTPELARLVTEPDTPRVYDRSAADPFIREWMRTLDIEWLAAAAIRSSDLLFGVLTAAWRHEGRPRDDDAVRQLAAIADQAAGAWEKAVLVEQINRQARLDPLTGLANRSVFTELLGRLLARRHGAPLAVLFCDLDRFKSVNDALGHAAGDDLLVAVGRRLQHCVRSDDLVARLGGDEFTILLTGISDEWSPEVFAAKVRQAMGEPLEVAGSRVVVHLSIGATTATPGTASVKDVLSRADTAMYVAKARGGDRLLMFEESMLLERSERLELETALTAAIADRSQLFVLYQPQVEIASGRVVGVEALVRWRHPTRGVLPPDEFLSLAEETGQIVEIDLHVLHTALADQALWEACGTALRVAVNFSARTLTRPGLLSELDRCITRSSREGMLEIELTESTAVSDPLAMRGILLAVRDLGISVAVDDVGTGYSSLALLHQLPAQRIKIDRSFVQRIADSTASRSVVEAVLLLADRLGQSAVAEGVETTEQAAELQALGCELAQGYLYAPPRPAEEVPHIVAGGLRPAPTAGRTTAGGERGVR